MQPEQFLRERFREYYSGHAVSPPPCPEMREFGFGTFGRKIADRHLSFSGGADFNSFLRSEVPLYISYSAAYYKYPARKPMPAKEYLGGDLVYEFDADDLRTDCRQKHDSWKCRCGASGKGSQERCTECGEGVTAVQWVCPECLGKVKEGVFELLKFLRDDFGFSPGISINFSGHKGYHVHVRDAEVRQLSPGARVELVDYLTAHGMDFREQGFYMDKGGRMFCPKPGEAAGWGKRLADGLVGLFQRADEDEIAVAGGIPAGSLPRKLASESRAIIDEINQGILHQLEKGSKQETERFWNSALAHVAARTGLSIDRQTSVDVAKIVRVPGTLHGGTGLLAKTVSPENLAEFEPLRDAVVFSRAPVKVKTNSVPEFYLGGETFGPFEPGTAELPEFAAVYLLARGEAYGTEL